MPKTMKTFRCDFSSFRLAWVFIWGTTCLSLGCENQRAASPERSANPVPVTIDHVVQKQMSVAVSAVGNVEAFALVSVIAQVGGRVEKVHFREGDTVRRGDLLFTLDRRPFEAALSQARAQLERDRVLAANAESDLKRYETLVGKAYVSREQFEKQQTQVTALQATLRADQSAVQSARLNLQYATIRSPIEGRTGTLLVDQGNVVKANDKPLVVIRQVQPIYVRFSVPERYLARIRQNIGTEKLRVEARIPDAEEGPVLGELSFMDNTVDTATGTVGLKALFPNSDETLWPGQYVDVTLLLSVEPNAIVVPAVALQQSSEGDFVLLLRDDQTVTVRKVKVSRIEDQKAVIQEGLSPGEKVVTDGQFQLTDGSKVVIKGAPPRQTEGTDPETEAAKRSSSGANASPQP